MGEYVIGKISCCFLMSNSHCLWRLYPKVLLGINKWVSFLGHVDAYEMDSSMWNHFMLIKCWFDICIQRYINRASQIIRIHKGSLLAGGNMASRDQVCCGWRSCKPWMVLLVSLKVSLFAFLLWLSLQWGHILLAECRAVFEEFKPVTESGSDVKDSSAALHNCF